MFDSFLVKISFFNIKKYILCSFFSPLLYQRDFYWVLYIDISYSLQFLTSNSSRIWIGSFRISDIFHLILNLPPGSENDFRIWNVKLLLKSMLTAALALEMLLKIAEYPHSEDHNASFSLVQWTPCRKWIACFFPLNQRKISRLSWYSTDLSHSESMLLIGQSIRWCCQ